MSSGHEDGNSEENALLAEVYRRLGERTANLHARSYDVDAAAARYREWLSRATAEPDSSQQAPPPHRTRGQGLSRSRSYGRLTEDPEGYAPNGWPGGLTLQIASDALAARRVQALAGENCTVVLTDVVGFGAPNRKDRHRLIIRREGWAMMRAAVAPVLGACFAEDRGDGVLIVATSQIPTVKIMEGIHRELPSRLRLHNSTYAEPCQFWLRLAVNVGPVTTDPLGMSGEAIIRTARLVEAPALKEAMKETGHGLGIIVSEFVYQTAIQHADQFIDADRYQGVDVSLKEFHHAAWIRLYDLSPRVGDHKAFEKARRSRK